MFHIVSGYLVEIETVLYHEDDFVAPTQKKTNDLQIKDNFSRLVTKPEDLFGGLDATTRCVLRTLQITLQNVDPLAGQGPMENLFKIDFCGI